MGLLLQDKGIPVVRWLRRRVGEWVQARQAVAVHRCPEQVQAVDPRSRDVVGENGPEWEPGKCAPWALVGWHPIWMNACVERISVDLEPTFETDIETAASGKK